MHSTFQRIVRAVVLPRMALPRPALFTRNSLVPRATQLTWNSVSAGAGSVASGRLFSTGSGPAGQSGSSDRGSFSFGSFFSAVKKHFTKTDRSNSQTAQGTSHQEQKNDEMPKIDRSKFESILADANKGDASCQAVVGMCYKLGLYVKVDDTEGARWFRMAAEQNFAPAQLWLGICYAEGSGVPQDYKEALKWYLRAAENGDADGAYNAGVLYSHGRGTEVNLAEAMKYFRMGAEAKHPESAVNLGKLFTSGTSACEVNHEEARKWFKLAADQDYAPGQWNLALSYFGVGGAPVDAAKAIEWLTKSAENGFPRAQFTLGAMYMQGAEGLPQSRAKAMDYFKRGAESGDFDSLVSLGELYTDDFVKSDLSNMDASIDAVKYLNLANKVRPGQPHVNALLGFHYSNSKDASTRQVGMKILTKESQHYPLAAEFLKMVEQRATSQ